MALQTVEWRRRRTQHQRDAESSGEEAGQRCRRWRHWNGRATWLQHQWDSTGKWEQEQPQRPSESSESESDCCLCDHWLSLPVQCSTGMFDSGTNFLRGKSFLFNFFPGRSQPQFGDRGFFGKVGDKEQIWSSCLRYYAHYKMMAIKMVFVRFEGRTN